ncbi:nucleotide pyrophosphohydrolase [Candidatus Woesearchaeota archaeon]|nr:nucleotide pyrophosphohydrolase [Candidatus Woesearchaeota archaeon]
MASDLEKLKEKIREFDLERDWEQFHNPKDLLVALVSEMGELAECYRWLSKEELTRVHSNPEKKEKVEEEIADIMMFLIRLAHQTDIDIINAVEKKLERIKEKYPSEKVKGVHTNFIEGFKGKE